MENHRRNYAHRKIPCPERISLRRLGKGYKRSLPVPGCPRRAGIPTSSTLRPELQSFRAPGLGLPFSVSQTPTGKSAQKPKKYDLLL